jgi:hypothetical protein
MGRPTRRWRGLHCERALAPWLFALISEAGGTGVALTSFGVLAVVAACLYLIGVRLAAGRTTVTT